MRGDSADGPGLVHLTPTLARDGVYVKTMMFTKGAEDIEKIGGGFWCKIRVMYKSYDTPSTAHKHPRTPGCPNAMDYATGPVC